MKKKGANLKLGTSTVFAITISNSPLDKNALNAYALTCRHLTSEYVIAQEKHHVNDISSIHLHLFIRFKEVVSSTVVLDKFRVLLPQAALDVRFCKSPKAWLVYITKEDDTPITYNIPESSLSLRLRTLRYCEREIKLNSILKESDPFLFNTDPRWKSTVRSVITQYIQDLNSAHILEETSKNTLQHTRCAIAKRILSWKPAPSSTTNGRHLYIYGPPGTGKTKLCLSVLQRLGMTSTLRVSGWGPFTFASIQKTTDSIMLDDFVYTPTFMQIYPQFLNIIDSMPVAIGRKYLSDLQAIFHISAFFTSNQPPNVNMSQLQRRCSIFQLTHKHWECNGDCEPKNTLETNLNRLT